VNFSPSRLGAPLLCLLAAAGPASAADAAPSQPIVIRAAHLFDGVSGRLVDGGTILVQGGRIQAVGANAQAPAGARIVDLGDATLLPGFIDSHVHLSDEASQNWYRDFFDGMQRFPAEQSLYGALYAKRSLEAGFTSVRDVGS